jgi:hypothetical protein
MAGWIRDVLACRRAVREVDALSVRDLNELGLSRDEARTFARTSCEVTARVAGMASVYGLEADDIQRDAPAYRELVAACATCSRVGECRDRLKDAPHLTPDDVVFCPNAKVYAAKAGGATDPLFRVLRLA